MPTRPAFWQSPVTAPSSFTFVHLFLPSQTYLETERRGTMLPLTVPNWETSPGLISQAEEQLEETGLKNQSSKNIWAVTDEIPALVICKAPPAAFLCEQCQWWGIFLCCPAPTKPSDKRCFSLLSIKSFSATSLAGSPKDHSCVSPLLWLFLSTVVYSYQGASLRFSCRLDVNSSL